MPPQLTETWAVAYLQVLIALLLFAIGVPALLFQAIVPEDIRKIIHKYMKMTYRPIYLFAVVITVLAIAFIWILHPCTNLLDPWKQWFAAFGVTIALTATILSWWIYLGKMIRERVIRQLCKKAKKRFEKDGILPDELLRDLIALGERSEPGQEKQLVLDAIGNLAVEIQSSEKYKGEELEVLLRNIERIVVNIDKPGNKKNFYRFKELLAEIFPRIPRNAMKYREDVRIIQSILKNIGSAALNRNFLVEVTGILDLNFIDDESIFVIGIAAFKKEKYWEATIALNKLEGLAIGVSDTSQNDSARYYLGLASHFWQFNSMARRRVTAFLKPNISKLSAPFPELLKSAVEFFYSAMVDYDTAEKLQAMRKNKSLLIQELGISQTDLLFHSI